MKNTPQILLVSNSFDIHVDNIEFLLNRKQQPFFRINLDQFPKDYQFKISLSPLGITGFIKHLSSGKKAEHQNIGAVWMRKPAAYNFLSDDLGPQELAYAKQETEHAFFSWLYSLDCYWLSHPLAMRGAMWKGEQLKRAQKYGFATPLTLITNSSFEARLFNEKLVDDMIFKAMSSPYLAAAEVKEEDIISRGINTTVIDEDMIEDLDAVNEVPCQFQNYIRKDYELRVTVIGDRIFAVRINSQDDERTVVDSRNSNADISYSKAELPKEIEIKTLEFVKSYNLEFSAIDFIVTPDNEYVFLENNPNGQFLYLEHHLPNLGIMNAVADKLITEAKCHH